MNGFENRYVRNNRLERVGEDRKERGVNVVNNGRHEPDIERENVVAEVAGGL